MCTKKLKTRKTDKMCSKTGVEPEHDSRKDKDDLHEMKMYFMVAVSLPYVWEE